jgi:hypothetical protein
MVHWCIRLMVVVALIFLSVSCQRNNETNETQNDSSFFSSAYGQSKICIIPARMRLPGRLQG